MDMKHSKTTLGSKALRPMRRNRHRLLNIASVIFMTGGLMQIPTALAASFDCKKASTNIEKMICDSDLLSPMDEDMAEAYRIALKHASNVEVLKDRQRQWLSNVNNCKNENCLQGLYWLRISHLRDGNGATDYVKSPTPLVIQSFEEASGLLESQNQQLKVRQKNARDMLFLKWDGQEDKTGYCKRFWQALEIQDRFAIPKPLMFASSPEEKQKLFDKVYGYAKSNFNQYLAQNGKLSPDTFTDVEGDIKRLNPYIINDHLNYRKVNDPKYLPENFNKIWAFNKDTHSFSYNSGLINSFIQKHELIDSAISVRLLYLMPYPVSGYTHPLVVTLVKDQCTPCTGLSLGISSIAVNGLSGTSTYLSQPAYVEAIRRYEDEDTGILPGTPFKLAGIGLFTDEFIFWELHEETHEEFKSGGIVFDHDEYYRNFRRYVVDVFPISEGTAPACSVQFN